MYYTEKQKEQMETQFQKLRVFCFLMTKYMDIEVLHFIRLYSDNSYALFANNQNWSEYFVENHLSLNLMEDRLGLGFQFWSEIDSIQVQQATYSAKKKFGFSFVSDIVQASPCDVGCYDFYTFAVHKKTNKEAKTIYTKQRPHLTEFVVSMQNIYREFLHSNPLYCQKVPLPHQKNDLAEEERMNHWMEDMKYAHDLFMKSSYLNYLNTVN